MTRCTTGVVLGGLLPLLSLSCPAGQAGASTIHVDWTGGGDYLTIQEGIDAATSGDTVLVAPGAYHEHLYMGSEADGIALLSEAGPEFTVVTNDSLYPNTVLKCEYLGSGTLIQGFTFRAGHTNEFGAGIQCLHAAPRIVGNVVEECWSYLEAGGIGCWDGNARIEGNLIRNNRATDAGGMSIVGGQTVVIGNTITSNEACGFGGTELGGGLRIEVGTHVVESNTFAENYAMEGGGGLAIISSSGTVLISNVIDRNSASYKGGGLYVADSMIEVCGNRITGNSSSFGAAMVILRPYSQRGSEFLGNVFFGNTCPASGAIVVQDGLAPTFSTNFLVNNSMYEVLLSNAPDPDTLDFTGNWWGTPDPDSIATIIYDCNDDPGIGACVDFSDWCSDPSCSGQVTFVPDDGMTSPLSWGRLKARFRQTE